MNEDDLNQGLRQVLERSTPPPPMDSSYALELGRTARRRRRLAWSGVAVVPLVAAAGLGPALVASLGSGGPGGDLAVSGGGPTKAPVSTKPVTTATSAPSAAPTTRKSGDPWPEGQTDRTATAGPRMVRVTKLLDDLSSSVPAGFSTPDLKSPDGYHLRSAQAQYASDDGEPDYWQYAAALPVEKAGKVGKLLVNSTTPNGKPASDPCKLAKSFWGGTGSCSVVDVGDKSVGVVTTKGQAGFDQWASYRYDDGTVVVVAQARKYQGQPQPALPQPIFTARQLAELVTSPKLKVS